MRNTLRGLTLSVGVALVFSAASAALRADDPAAPAAAPAAAAAPAQVFDSPDAALKALVQALKDNDDAALEQLAGSGSADVVASGKDSVVARERRRVARMASEKVVWEDKEDGTKVAVLGFKAWPMPLPVASKDGKWFFDVEKGRKELLARRIGKNELEVMDLMRVVVEAQTAYKAKDRDGDGVLEYAQRFVSTPGTKDGLYWPDPDDVALEDRSPFGAMEEELKPYADGTSKGAPYGGYYFKLLAAQGCSAPGGALDFSEGLNMTRGFAVLAVPAEYRKTGVMSFMISHHGLLLDKDLGPNGNELSKSITFFEPDASWRRLPNP